MRKQVHQIQICGDFFYKHVVQKYKGIKASM